MMKIYAAKTNHLTNPLGFRMEHIVFSWKVEDAVGSRQEWARIRVASDAGMTELLFDSGEDPAADSLAYRISLSLSPRTRYYWTVRVRSDAGEEAESAVQWFETAKLEEAWQADWITGGAADRHPVFHRRIERTEGKAVEAARLYICGLGLYEAYYNGNKIGNEHLTPFCNDYNEWVQYQTFDVTDLLQQDGTLSVLLGNGWYNGRFGPDDRTGKPFYGTERKLIAELHVQYADGSEDVIGTDESWTVSGSSVTFSNIYDGEIRDDTLPETPETPAAVTAPPVGALTARLSPPLTVQEEVPVKEVIHTPAGETVLDLGQNLSGLFRLFVRVPRGRTVHLQFGEILQNGSFYRDNLRTAKAEYVYISDGEAHVLEPKFTFYGYRYVKVEGIENPAPENFTALVLHSELDRTGEIQTGSPLVNQLLSNIDWGLRGNFLDVPTDCPQRDERMGWTGDAQVFAPTANYLRDCFAFYSKYLYDLKREQDALGGAVPDVVPSFGRTSSSAAWGDAACVIPMVLYDFYGDRSVLEEQYESMCGWIAYIRRVDGTDHGWRRKFHYGDWLALDADRPDNLQGGTEVGFVADVMALRCVRLTAEAARILGRTQDRGEYETLAEAMLNEIRNEYFTPSGRPAVTTQTALLLAKKYGLSPAPERIAAALEARLKADDGHLKTGFVGTPILLPMLSECGRSDMAYDLLLYEGYPGWLYEVKMGATTVWERWDSVGPDGIIADNGMNSLNHYAYGSAAEWIFGCAAGLRPAAPGFRRAVIAPEISAALGHLECTYDSAAGRWQTAWKVTAEGAVSFACTVPFGCTAELTLPYGGGSRTLTAGHFEITYEPDQPLKTVFTVDTPLGQLLDTPKARALLTRAIPKITQLPPSMRGMSIRQIMQRMGGADENTLGKLNALLKSV